MRLPERIAVIGGGRMGAGIALTFAFHGAQVFVVERTEESAVQALRRLEGLASVAVMKDSNAPDYEVLLGRMSVTGAFVPSLECDLIIEAVQEDFAVKADTLRAIESQVGETVAIATNTSSLSVTKLSRELSHPERFFGLHFFNPVPPSKLIEIVVGDATDDELVARAQEWAIALSKTPVVVSDSPGFASSRLGVALALEAMRMLEEGVASAEDIDASMVLGYRHASGPLRTTDLVGLDVRLGIAEHLTSELGERFVPPQILRNKVAAGDLGRKSGRGFFEYQ